MSKIKILIYFHHKHRKFKTAKQLLKLIINLFMLYESKKSLLCFAYIMNLRKRIDDLINLLFINIENYD